MNPHTKCPWLSRRISLWRVTRDDLVRGARFDDAVCRVSFCVDIHALDPKQGKGIDASGVKVQPYDIPLRALIARDAPNLMMAGRCISGDFAAHASYRVTGVAAALGEAEIRVGRGCPQPADGGVLGDRALRHALEGGNPLPPNADAKDGDHLYSSTG